MKFHIWLTLLIIMITSQYSCNTLRDINHALKRIEQQGRT